MIYIVDNVNSQKEKPKKKKPTKKKPTKEKSTKEKRTRLTKQIRKRKQLLMFKKLSKMYGKKIVNKKGKWISL